MFKRNHTASSDTVYEALKEDILHLVLPPGAAISEIETAERFRISRTPVRDAFKRLEREGLLEIQPHIGTFISLIDLDTITDILYIRDVLECATLLNLIPIYNESSDLQICILLEKQKAILESDLTSEELGRAFLQADHEFHNTLFTAAGKPNIHKYLNQLNYQYERFRTYINFNGKGDLKKLYHSHKEMVECPLLLRGGGFCTLSHRDYLGALLALGIERHVLGDLVVLDDCRALLFCNADIAPFICAELDRVGRDGVKVQRLPEDAKIEIPRRYKSVSDTVASARFDCIAAALAGLSREKAQMLIRAGECTLDYEPCDKCDKIIEPPCVISLRGYGKFRVDDISMQTKKGRLRMLAQKYI